MKLSFFYQPFFCYLLKINHNNSNIELSPKALVFSKIFYNNLLKIGCNKSNIEISHIGFLHKLFLQSYQNEPQ